MTHPDDGSGPEDLDEELDTQSDDTWDAEAEVTCPCCGEEVTIGLDPGGGSSQTYVEDCQVCCQPWRVHVRYDEHGVAAVQVEAA